MDPSIWDCLDKQNGEGMLLTSCGAELQELMRQIDIMVRNKKMEWEAELHSIHECLTMREQELVHTRTILDQKHQEVGILKHQLESYESGQKCVVKEYEMQLNRLNCQLKNLKDSHEKMQRHRTKRNQAAGDKEKEMLAEIESLKNDLKEKQSLHIQHEKENSEWDIRKRALQHQIECLETQKRALASNYERVQQQLALAQTRLKRSNRMVEEVEGTSQSLLKKLEEELSNDKELIQRQETLIAELQTKTRELNSARHTATEEKYRYQEQVDKANCRMRVLEEEVDKLQAALSARETALRGSEHELAELRNKNEDMKCCLHTKEKIIEAMQVRSPLKKKEDELNHKIATLEGTTEAMVETERKLKKEVATLKLQLQAAKSENEKLNECFQKTEFNKVSIVNDEINRLRAKLEEMEATHSTQLCGMKAEVTKLTSHLHGRDANITRLGETCAEMERQLREESQRRDKLDAELQIAAANLQTLRQQRTTNASDHDVIAPIFSSADKSLTEAESQLSFLRQNYGKAVERLEDENQQLKYQVDGLKSELAIKEKYGSGDASSNSLIRISDKKIVDDGKITELCQAYEHRIAALEAHIQSMQSPREIAPPLTSASSIAIRSVNSDGGISKSSSPSSSSVNSKARTPTPTSNFLQAIGIENKSVNSSAFTLPASVAGSLSEKHLNALLGLSDEGFDETASPGVEEFAKEEDKRIELLETRIEKHIDGMRKAMDLAMEKYMAKS